jgi:putative phosphoesterase
VKVAILSDIHGNLAALNAVLANADEEGVEHFIMLGDVIGYYYSAAAVISCIRQRSVLHAIRGNHERLFSEVLVDEEAALRYRKRYGSSLEIARSTLSTDDIEWLSQLPDQATVQLDGLVLKLCHGSPMDPDQYVYPDADAATLDACRTADGDFILMGHTHYPMLLDNRRPILFNPGSVGQARDRGGEACWGLLNTRTKSAKLMRTGFDARALADEAKRRDPHLPFLADVLFRRRSN